MKRHIHKTYNFIKALLIFTSSTVVTYNVVSVSPENRADLFSFVVISDLRFQTVK